MDDLTDFLENGLYDPAFVHFDPDSPTRMFQLSPPDFLYSVYRPDLGGAGRHRTAGRPAACRRTTTTPCPDVTWGSSSWTSQTGVTIALIAAGSRDDDDDGDRQAADGGRKGEGHEGRAGEERRVYRITNNGTSPVDTHLLVIARGLSFQVEMTNASGRTSNGDPYRRVFLPNGVLTPGQSIDVTLRFRRHRQSPPVSFTLTLLSGQGNP